MQKFQTTKSNIWVLSLAIVLSGLNLFLCLKFFNIATWLFILLIVVNSLVVVCSLVIFFLNKTSFLRTLFIFTVILSLFCWLYQILVWCGYSEIFTSIESMQNFIAQTGAWGMVVFCLIQFLQVVVLPIPGAITTIAGAILFGPTITMVLSIFSIMIGSYVSFFIGRFFGEKVVIWIVGKETCEKYSKLLYEKGKYIFFLMMVFPFFPDDVLCMIAGMTTMRLRFFTITMLIARPLGIIPTCYLGGGTVIPYSGWGLIVWGILILTMVVFIILSWKYQAKIEQFVSKLSEKMNKKSKTENQTLEENKKEINIDQEEK